MRTVALANEKALRITPAFSGLRQPDNSPMKMPSIPVLGILGFGLCSIATQGVGAEGRAMAAGNGSPNTLFYYDPSLVKTADSYGPLFSQYIPRSNGESLAPGDFVESIRVPDGSEVRVL